MAKSEKYFIVVRQWGWNKEDVAERNACANWYELIRSKESIVFKCSKLMTADYKDELTKIAREERESARWGQQYSRNPRKGVYKFWIQQCDRDGRLVLTKKQREGAIAWAKNAARESVEFAQDNAEFIAQFEN